MTPRNASKRRLLLLTVLQQVPATLFLYGEPFYAQRRFGWGPGQIGLTQAVSGISVACGSFLGGQIAHRFGPRRSLLLAMSGSLAAVIVGIVVVGSHGPFALAATLAWFSFAQALGWPGLEACIMAGEPATRVQHLVGQFNLTWSLGTATAFLLATPIMNAFGLTAIFWVPAILYLTNLVMLRALMQGSAGTTRAAEEMATAPQAEESGAGLRQTDAYRRMAWIANPFSYVAILSVVTFSPSIRSRLHLSFADASVWCGLWFYIRALTFEILRRWNGWHYRWRGLCASYVTTMVAFAALVMAPNLVVLVAAELVFGLCVGMNYQSSLYYSMAGSDASGAHSGLHECLIGLGNTAGPLLAWVGSEIAPGSRAVPLVMVIGVMSLGLAGIVRIGSRLRQA